ncbi:hypothetical protein KJ975_00985 [Myxococcota bacterium]|nr:hypothetical protein [Myxococcota bacterium]
MIALRFHLLLLILWLAAGFGCDHGRPGDPCAGITCSDHGSCVTDDTGAAACDCEEGFHTENLTCIEDNVAPELTSAGSLQVPEQVVYTHHITCIDSNGDDLHLDVLGVALCAGTLTDHGDGTGDYVFGPTTETDGGSNCALSVICTDAHGEMAEQTVSVEIVEANAVPVMMNLPAEVGLHWRDAGEFQATATDPDVPADTLQWNLAETDCNFSPVVEAAGLVSWTCSRKETCALLLRVVDSGEVPLSAEGTLTVRCVNTPPVIEVPPPTTAVEGLRTKLTASCADPDGDPVTLRVDDAWDTCGGTISGDSYIFTPTAAQGGGTCVAGFTCSDTQDTVIGTTTVSVTAYTGPIQLRIIAGNLTSGNYSDYDSGHGLRILQALRPDLALVQEMNYLGNTVANYDAFSGAIVGTDHWAVDDAWFELPNGILSRWPILSSGWWDDPTLNNRELLWAEIDLPGPVDLFAISVHLHTSPAADQVTASLVIVNAVKAHRQAFPGRFLYVVGGDFNGTSSVSAAGFGTDGVFSVAPPHPVDDLGNVNTNAPRSKQYDFVLGDPALRAMQVPVVFESAWGNDTLTYPNGLVFDTRTFTQEVLDEFFPPALTTDSAAAGMQHMAIVKDYLLP